MHNDDDSAMKYVILGTNFCHVTEFTWYFKRILWR